MKKIVVIICAFLFFISCNNSKMEWVETTQDIAWQSKDVKTIEIVNKKADVIVDITNPLQTIDGFGACFNELGWTSLSLLNKTDRDNILRELFDFGVGANFTVCRMPVGANDFSRGWYSYNETDGDFEMKNFSISNDLETLVPFIKNALTINPALKIWASPWSPPVWMKENKHYACQPLSRSVAELIGSNGILPEQVRHEGMDMFMQEDAYFKAYALYFRKFIEAYRAENIDIFMVMPQNEFNSCQNFPSCTWKAAGLATFIGKYLGPEMNKIGVELMFGTMERPNAALADTSLLDPDCKKYISGVGFQWAGKQSIGDIHRRYPHLKIYQTEQECGDGRNDWRGCVYSWELMKHYLNNGTSVYDYWNISLEEDGLSHWGWRQNSLITVKKDNKTYKYTYEYYLMKHVSHYVLPDARFLPVSGAFTDLMAFRNADGSYVLVIFNSSDKEIKPVIQVGDRTIAVELNPQSFNTIKL